MKKYLIKVALRGISPMVWRRLSIPGTTSLALLHQVIQIAYDWDNEHLHQFHIYGKDYGVSYMGGMSFADDAHKILIDDFNFDVGDKFTYEYNFFENNIVDIRIESIKNTASYTSIACIKGNGMPGMSKYDEVEPTLDLLNAIINSNEITTVSDIKPLIDKLNSVKFNLNNINRRFTTEIEKNNIDNK